MQRYGHVFAVALAKNPEQGLDKYQVIFRYVLWYKGVTLKKRHLTDGVCEFYLTNMRQPHAFKVDLELLNALPEDKKFVLAFPQWAGHDPRFRKRVQTEQGLCETLYASLAVDW